MTDKEKLEKLKKLADVMYYAAQQLTTDASRLHKAMDEYHEFIIHECKEEPVSEELEEAAFDYAEACKYDGGEKLLCVEHFKAGAEWQKEQMMKKAFPVEIGRQRSDYKCVLHGNFFNCDTGDKVKAIIIKED